MKEFFVAKEIEFMLNVNLFITYHKRSFFASFFLLLVCIGLLFQLYMGLNAYVSAMYLFQFNYDVIL
jgi:hypothetical protein